MHAALLVVALAAAADLAMRQPDVVDTQVKRVRAALEKPPSKLTLPEVKADFRVHIEERRPLQFIFDTPPWQLPSIGWRPPAMTYSAFGTPMMSVDLGAIGSAIMRRVNNGRRAHAVRESSAEVRQAIAEYCAAQPNAATILICSSPPPIR